LRGRVPRPIEALSWPPVERDAAQYGDTPYSNQR
jgi:hypothetical protein